jgi:hypothetical protein
MIRHLFAPALIVCVLACGEREAATIGQPPATRLLSIESVIVGIRASGAASDARCGALLVDATWGNLVRIDSVGQAKAVGRLAGDIRTARLSLVGPDSALFWSHAPEAWGWINLRTGVVSPLPVAEHPWGEQWAGPAMSVAGTLVMSPLGDQDAARPRPAVWRPTGFAEVLTAAGELVGSISSVRDRGGRYLTWMAATATVGHAGDTLLIARRSTAELFAYLISHDGSSKPLWASRLPNYFRSPDAREEVRSLPWIDVHGDFVKFLQVSQIDAATFTPDGHLIAVRNYRAKYEWHRDRIFQEQGDWKAISKGLEVYDRHGKRLAAYAVPGGRVAWISAGSRGRLFFGAGDSVLVAQSPWADDKCPRLPARITAPNLDRPFGG